MRSRGLTVVSIALMVGYSYEAGARRPDGFREFPVRDYGNGIEEKYFEKVFVTYRRLHPKEASRHRHRPGDRQANHRLSRWHDPGRVDARRGLDVPLHPAGRVTTGRLRVLRPPTAATVMPIPPAAPDSGADTHAYLPEKAIPYLVGPGFPVPAQTSPTPGAPPPAEARAFPPSMRPALREASRWPMHPADAWDGSRRRTHDSHAHRSPRPAPDGAPLRRSGPLNRRLAAIALVALLALAGFGIRWAVTDPPGAPSGPPAPIRIGSSAYELSALLYIADDQGYFTANGLDATLRPYGLSTLAIRGMESGDADISLSGEYSIVQEAFQGANISVIACIDKSQNSVLIYRNDRGIETVPDLRGKRIGISRATQSEFTFGRYLDLNDLSPQDVTLVDLPSPQYVEAIANGTVDGVVSGYSYVDLVRERLGRTASFWRIYQSQPYYWVMAGQNDWIAGHPEAVERLLRSLVSAEEYAVDHPADARAIVGRRLNHTDAYMAEVWPNHHFSLSLDESLVIAMEDEARWMIANNLTNATTPPDLRKYIDTTALAQVDPGAVTIL